MTKGFRDGGSEWRLSNRAAVPVGRPPVRRYRRKTWGKKYPKIQLLTVAELLAGKKIEMPPIRQVDATFKRAERHRPGGGTQLEIKDPESD